MRDMYVDSLKTTLNVYKFGKSNYPLLALSNKGHTIVDSYGLQFINQFFMIAQQEIESYINPFTPKSATYRFYSV